MKKTIAQIRQMLFQTGFYAVIAQDEMTNEEARTFLFNIKNQEHEMNVVEMENHFLIY